MPINVLLFSYSLFLVVVSTEHAANNFRMCQCMVIEVTTNKLMYKSKLKQFALPLSSTALNEVVLNDRLVSGKILFMKVGK